MVRRERERERVLVLKAQRREVFRLRGGEEPRGDGVIDTVALRSVERAMPASGAAWLNASRRSVEDSRCPCDAASFEREELIVEGFSGCLVAEGLAAVTDTCQGRLKSAPPAPVEKWPTPSRSVSGCERSEGA
jgi:hypothetical protein